MEIGMSVMDILLGLVSIGGSWMFYEVLRLRKEIQDLRLAVATEYARSASLEKLDIKISKLLEEFIEFKLEIYKQGGADVKKS